jgi:hypothetical protein
MRQTAVEWLVNEYELYYNGESKLTYCEIIEQAKEKFYRQISNAYQSGNFDGFNKTSVDYYKETFESEEKEIEF